MSTVHAKVQEQVDACDVVVVGAGLVGAAVAARLAGEELSVAVLEARRVAGGATCRSTGIVLTGLSEHYSQAVSTYGRDQAQEIWSLTSEGRDRLAESARSLSVRVGRRGSLRMATTDEEVEVLRDSSDLLQEDGFNAWFGRRDLMGRGFCAALCYPDDLTVDTTGLTNALLRSADITVHEGCEVRYMEMDHGGVLVWSRDRMVRCGAVVLAVNGYAPLLDPYFRVKVIPSRILGWMSEPLDELIVEQPVVTHRGHTLCHQLSDRRLLLGQWQSLEGGPGKDAANGHSLDDLDDPLEAGLASFAEKHFPELLGSQRTHKSSGLNGLTPDRLPIVGSLPHLPAVYFAVGLECPGLAWSFVAADRVANLLLEGSDPGILSVSRLQ